jgi:hypothetical protein
MKNIVCRAFLVLLFATAASPSWAGSAAFFKAKISGFTKASLAGLGRSLDGATDAFLTFKISTGSAFVQAP